MSIKDYWRERERWVFDALEEHEMFTVEIAMKLETDCATVNYILKKLEKRGMIDCRNDKGKNLWKIKTN